MSPLRISRIFRILVFVLFRLWLELRLLSPPFLFFFFLVGFVWRIFNDLVGEVFFVALLLFDVREISLLHPSFWLMKRLMH